MENIPAYIFDWIEKIPYSSLTPAQQNEALQYLSEEEYAQMHLAARQAAGFFAPAETDNTAVFAALNQRFDEVHKPQPVRNKIFTLHIWQVAASLLLLAVGYLGVLLYNKQAQAGTVQAGMQDTVYIERHQPAKEIRVHDTVFITMPPKSAKRTEGMPSADTLPMYRDEINLYRLDDMLGTLSIQDKDAPQNALKNRSIQNDTFIKGFDYVSL